MNIYIYGNQAFKKEIHSTLEHANIKFKLDDNSLITDINSIEELKEAIQNNPHDIYLIDDEKIIKKNSKIKFLTPKDGIEEEFLLDNGIADLSVDSLKEIPKYILKKHEEQKSVDEDIHSSIIDIVDEAYEKEDKVELDDELATLLAKEENENLENNNLTSLDDISADINLDTLELSSEDGIDDNPLNDEELEKLMSFDDDLGLNNSSLDYDEDLLKESENDLEEFDDSDLELDSLELEDLDLLEGFSDTLDEEKVQEKKNDLETDDIDLLDNDFDKNIEDDTILNDISENTSKGERMSDEFSELDSLNEQDILDALNGLNTAPIQEITTNSSSKKEETIAIDSSNININQLSELIGKLLQNKTLEITIKIKD